MLRLAHLSTGRRVRRRVVKVTGRSESQVEEIAFPIYSTLSVDGADVETTILASPGQIELHVAATGEDVSALDAVLDGAWRGCRQRSRPTCSVWMAARWRKSWGTTSCRRAGGLPRLSRAQAACSWAG